MTNLRHTAVRTRRASGWLAALCLALPLPAMAQSSRPLDLSRRGVICDRGTLICYDRNGVSPRDTRLTFGSRAERTLLRQLSGRPGPRQFQLSTGQLCNLRQQTCWDDGWQRRNVSNRLSRQLFGDSGDWRRANDDLERDGEDSGRWGRYGWGARPGWNQGQGWGSATAPDRWVEGSRDLAYCDLSQRGRSLFRGSCDLIRRDGVAGTDYVVDLRDGRQYAFSNRRGQLVLADASGLWPVQQGSNGTGAVFRWADLQLVASRSGDGNLAPNPVPNPSASILQELINNLFR